jgi:hypothetical protein
VADAAETLSAYPPRAHRQRVLKGATIIWGVNRSDISCIVKNQNAEGAGLVVPEENRIPQEFLLWIPTDGVAWRCRLRWRRGDRAGVSFHGSQPKPDWHY